VILFTVHAYCILADSNEFARLALHTTSKELHTYTLLQNNFALVLNLVYVLHIYPVLN
jgi:hypothetical protein